MDAAFNTNHFAQISNLIQKADRIADLNVIINQLIPLPELKQILLEKLSLLQQKSKSNTLSKDNDNNNNNQNAQNTLSLNRLYFNSYPFDYIFNDDIICSVIQYLSCSNMYNKLMVINKNFNRIMKTNSILYQQYRIQISLSNDLWSIQTNKLYINISHKLQLIEISSYPNHLSVNSIPLNSQSPHVSHLSSNQSSSVIYNNFNHYISFCIESMDDMNTKCPFIWYSIKKISIVTHLSDYDNMHTNSLIPSIISTFNDNDNKADKNDDNDKISLMEQLLLKCVNSLLSLKIDERIMSASPTGGMYGMYGLYTPNSAASNLFLNYNNHELLRKKSGNGNNKTINKILLILKKLINLKSLIHIQWITDESPPVLISFKDNVLMKSFNNLMYLDLIGPQSSNLFNNNIISNANKLLVFSIDLDDITFGTTINIANSTTNIVNDNNSYSDNDKNDNNNALKVIKFPSCIEFIQFKNYDQLNDNVILDLSLCVNIVTIQVIISNKNYNLSSIIKSIRWPNPNPNSKSVSRHLISCLIIKYKHKAMAPTYDTWNKWFISLKHNHNIPIKYIRCITNSHSNPIYLQQNSNNNNKNKLQYTSLQSLASSDIDININDNSNLHSIRLIKMEGILWKLLLIDKFKYDRDLLNNKILKYKKYFDMYLLKWIYHLGRDTRIPSSTSLELFDTSSYNDFNEILPNISNIGYNATSTLSINHNNDNVPQYNQISPVSSGVFIID